MRIGVLRGRENSFPEAFIAKVNSMGKGVEAEFIQLGGTKLNEPVPYRVILDRMSHEVPYYSVYLKMAALQGTYVINNTFWRSADDKFFGYCAAEKLGIAEPQTVVLPNREYVDDVTAESLRNLWPTDFAYYAEFVGLPCIMKPAFGGGWKDVYKIHDIDELMSRYNESTPQDDDAAGARDLGPLHPRPHHRPALGARHPLRPRPRRPRRLQPGLRHPAPRRPRQVGGAVAGLQPGPRLRHERAGVRVQGRQVLRHRPHQLHARPRLPQPQGRPLPLGGREDGGVRGGKGAVERADPGRPRTSGS